MKRILIFQFLLLALIQANAQNEFAATAFYTEFKKIVADAQAGFLENKGTPRKTGMEELVSEYKAKMLLPLADSGKLVLPVKGSPYVIYYFTPDKMRLKVDQLGANLRDAVATAFEEPLAIKSETNIVNNQPFSVLDYYPAANQSGPLLFRQVIYYFSGKFYLSFEIRGRRQ